MALLKLKDFDSNYKETFGGHDIKGLDVYSNVNNEKIGSVHDLLVDEQGHFRYFIVDLGFWGFGKKVLLPVGRAEIDNDGNQIRAIGFTREQAEHLPEFNESLKVDRAYEERVKGVYRPRPVEASERPLEAGRPLETPREVVYITPRATSGQPPTHQNIQTTSSNDIPGTAYYQPAQVPPTPPMPTPPVQQAPPVQQTQPTHPVPPIAPPMQQAPPVPVPSVQQVPPAQVPLSQVPPMPTPPVQQAPVQQMPTQQVPVQYVPVQQVPMQQVPTQQVPVQQMPMQQVPVQQVQVQPGYYEPSSSHYQQDPYMYGMNQQSHSVLQRYEERLLAKKRQENQNR